MTMDIKLARIDDRLIHGQVATVWAKATQINRILVVSDTVAYDNLRKMLLQQAAPPGVKVNVITVKKMIQIYNDRRFDSFKAMILFTNPQDVVQLVTAGIKIYSVNIGGMSFASGKQMVTNTISVDEEDVKAFKYLSDQEIELEVRKVITDTKVNLMDILKKKKLLDSTTFI